MAWLKGIPEVPGYYWMIVNFGTHQKHETLGIGLVLFDPYHYIIPTRAAPSPIVRTFLNVYGTTQDVGEGWGTTSFSRSDDVKWLYWNEPLMPPQGPGQFATHPAMPGPPMPPTPEEIAEESRKQKMHEKKRTKEEKKKVAAKKFAWKDAITRKLTLYFCHDCEEVFDEPGTMRQCSRDSCGNDFYAEPKERNCPDCNSPFTRIEEQEACPECETATDIRKVIDHGKVLFDPLD